MPVSENKGPLALEICDEIGMGSRPFIEHMAGSRFGLYEILEDGDDKSTLKELITGTKVTLDQSMDCPEPGSLALCRVVTSSGKRFAFGNIL